MVSSRNACAAQQMRAGVQAVRREQEVVRGLSCSFYSPPSRPPQQPLVQRQEGRGGGPGWYSAQ